MKPTHTILITLRPAFASSLADSFLEAIARTALTCESVPAAELGILLTDDDEIQALNREYAAEDSSTDVLAFSLQEGEEFAQPDDVLRLGEVIISYPTAERQARAAGRTTEQEIAHLLVHGVLHLLGYDHAEGEEEQRMRGREVEILTLK